MDIFSKTEYGDWDNSIFAQFLQDRADHAGVTPDKLREACQISKTTFWRWKSGNSEPQISKLRHLFETSEVMHAKLPCEAMQAFEGIKHGSSIAQSVLWEEMEEQAHPERVEDVIFWALDEYRQNHKDSMGGAVANWLVVTIKEREAQSLNHAQE